MGVTIVVLLGLVLALAGGVLAEPSEQAKGHYQAGLEAKQAKEYDKAILELKQALELDKDYVDAHWVLAWAYVAKKQKNLAGEQFRQVIRIGPDSDKGREAKTALERMGMRVTPEAGPPAQGTAIAPVVTDESSKEDGTASDQEAECPTFMSSGTALLDAARVAKLANGSWEHTDSEIIIKAEPEVHCPFNRKEFYTAGQIYPTTAASLYFSWLDIGLVPVRVLTLYGWKISWDGSTKTITVRSDTEQRAFHILGSTQFFAKHGAAPLPTLASGSGISYSSKGTAATAPSERQIYAALVRAEDRFGISRMEEARNSICKKYGITRKQLEDITVKGLMNQWPVPEGPRPGTAGYRQMLR